MSTTVNHWIDLAQDRDTGIETLRARFKGHAHAYDAHWHDSYLVGVTEQGVQQFNSRRNRYHSLAGNVFMLEPGEIHDGDAPTEGGFTYRTLYLDPLWLEREMNALFEEAPQGSQLGFVNPLATDTRLAQATSAAFEAIHTQELRIIRQSALDHLFDSLTGHLHWRTRYNEDPRLPRVAQVAREYLHAHLQHDISLDEVAAICGVDRFRLTRAFKAAYNLPPHAYLVQLRVAKARQLLSRGETPANVAMALGFADQSHLGRWFMRAYGLTPAAYRKRCSNLPDA